MAVGKTPQQLVADAKAASLAAKKAAEAAKKKAAADTAAAKKAQAAAKKKAAADAKAAAAAKKKAAADAAAAKKAAAAAKKKAAADAKAAEAAKKKAAANAAAAKKTKEKSTLDALNFQLSQAKVKSQIKDLYAADPADPTDIFQTLQKSNAILTDVLSSSANQQPATTYVQQVPVATAGGTSPNYLMYIGVGLLAFWFLRKGKR